MRLRGSLLLLLVWLLEVGSRSVTQEQVDLLLQQVQLEYGDPETLKSEDQLRKLNLAGLNEDSFDSPFGPGGIFEDMDPEESPGLFEGDIAFPRQTESLQFRVAINDEVFPTRKWPNNTVPYIISDKYDMNIRKIIEDAINALNFMTCVKFVPWDGKVKDYLVIWPVKKPAGCWSFIGKLGGAQLVSLQPPDKKSKRCFLALGKPIHEMLHALGFFHEQSRVDRNKYVYVIKKNVIPRFLNNFKLQAAINTTIEYEYDYGSVLHYGTNFFSKQRRQPTLVPLRNNTVIGQRNGLSVIDCLKVNSYYGCLQQSDYERMKFNAICRMLGVRTNQGAFENQIYGG